MRALAVAGFLLVAIMQVIFVVNAGDRPFPYREVQVLSLLGTLALVVGVARGEGPAIVGGFAVDAIGRVAQIVLGLSLLPLALNVLLAAGWIWAAVAAGRGRSVRGAVWVLAFAHFASLFFVLGRFTGAIALALGAAGLFLAAPNVGEREKEKGVGG